MGISKISDTLFGDTSKSKQLLAVKRKELLKKYKDPVLRVYFNQIGKKFISLGPMSLCEALLHDLGLKCPDKLLTGLGLTVFHISPHDDLIDETPNNKNDLAGLLYAGNISLLEGVNYLAENNLSFVFPNLTGAINENHFRQTKCAEILWQKKKPSKQKYFYGITHIKSWTSLGPVTALAFAKRNDLMPKVLKYCKHYGYAIQLLDDMREIEEDIVSGYWSLSTIIAKNKGWKNYGKDNAKKNYLITESRKMALKHIGLARKAIPRDWLELNDKLDRIEAYIKRFKY